jgi:ribosomal protein L11 methyltransferase
MKWAEISIQTSHEAIEPVADIFHDLGASGVVIEDPELINTYRLSGAWDYCDIPPEANPEVVIVKAYLLADEALDTKLRLFESKVNELSGHDIDKGRGEITWREIQEEDWTSSWKKFFHPIKVGEKIVIKPTWESYEAGVDDLVIELDPGMAFGTGTHHTTAMCIRLLEELVRPGMQVIDVGVGSGILSIVCAKLGASEVCSVDLDDIAVRVACENIHLNKVEHIVNVTQGDLLTGFSGQADLIVANIVADIIIKVIPDVKTRLSVGGAFVASGIIVERLSDVTTVLLANDFTVDKVSEEGGWVAIVARKE